MKGSAFGGQSPRVFPIPLYDPIVYDSGKRNGRTADLVTANWIGFFLEHIEGNGIVGRIIPIAGIRDASRGPGAGRPESRRRSGWSSKHGPIDASESRPGESPACSLCCTVHG